MSARTSEVPQIDDAPPLESSAWRRGLAVGARVVDRSSTVPVYAGIVIAIAGLVFIAVAWGEVAALTNVALQLPYLVSGGLTGLALVMVGMTIVNVQSRRRDSAERSRQMERLAGLLREVGGASRDASGRARSTRKPR